MDFQAPYRVVQRFFTDIKKLNESLLDSWKKTPQEIKAIINNGADVHFGDDYALRICSEYGLFENVKTLVALGADVRAKNDEALLNAVKSDPVRKYIVKDMGKTSEYLEVANLLLTMGSWNEFALKTACLSINSQMVDLLIGYGGDPLSVRWYAPNGGIASILITQNPNPWKDAIVLPIDRLQDQPYHEVNTVDTIKNTADNCDILFIDIDNTMICTSEGIKVLTDAWWIELLRTSKSYICIVTSRYEYITTTTEELAKFGIVYDALYFTNYNDRLKVEIYDRVISERGAKTILIADDMEEILMDAYRRFIDDEVSVTLFKWTI